MAASKGRCLTFRKLQNIFKVVPQCYILTSTWKISLDPCSHSDGCVAISRCAFDLHFCNVMVWNVTGVLFCCVSLSNIQIFCYFIKS